MLKLDDFNNVNQYTAHCRLSECYTELYCNQLNNGNYLLLTK